MKTVTVRAKEFDKVDQFENEQYVRLEGLGKEVTNLLQDLPLVYREKGETLLGTIICQREALSIMKINP